MFPPNLAVLLLMCRCFAVFQLLSRRLVGGFPFIQVAYNTIGNRALLFVQMSEFQEGVPDAKQEMLVFCCRYFVQLKMPM